MKITAELLARTLKDLNDIMERDQTDVYMPIFDRVYRELMAMKQQQTRQDKMREVLPILSLKS
ncbi:MAG: hypothetical protein JNK24_08870 [Alphaproteobacteria bacterium]|nr:hypothetical protein [Alphaproteobacteria bacterium]